jgi:ABC-type Fe3+ transport system permease subunit
MKGKEQKTRTDICYAQKIAHNRYLPQFSLSAITVSFTIIIFCYRLFMLQFPLPRGIRIYIISSLNSNRLHTRTRSNKILVLMALSFLSVTITITIFSPFDHVQVPTAAAQQENNNNNTKFVSLSTISTVIGTGAAATGAIVTVPGVMKTRKQSKFLAIYLLKIHNKYDELCRKTKPY